MAFTTVGWSGDIPGTLRILDQTRLPVETVYLELPDCQTLWEAIRSLRVRGAPAIGVAAAFGVVLGLQNAPVAQLDKALDETIAYLGSSRPTAVNLFWALERMRGVYQGLRGQSRDAILHRLLKEAQAILDEDLAMCHAIGEHGAACVPETGGVLTHCNAGGLATAGFGTALGVIRAAWQRGKRIRVYADETRPLLQGARLTAWELQQAGIPATLICDNMAAMTMRQGKIHMVVTGADRIAANGDSANKIGTYGVAVLAKAHDIPFYIAAPFSTFDFRLATGAEIPIEERAAEEITHGFGRQTAPTGISVYNPAFDVTPAELIAGIITERGVLRPPYGESIRAYRAATATGVRQP